MAHDLADAGTSGQVDGGGRPGGTSRGAATPPPTAIHAAETGGARDSLHDAYAFLQKVIGVIAFLLPPVLIVGLIPFKGPNIMGSISAYYYTSMHGVFIGALWAIGVFFLSYQVRPVSPEFQADNVLAYIASLLAILVSLLPTTQDAGTATHAEKVLGTVHLLCAGVLFAMLAAFALVLFRFSEDGDMAPQKRKRNVVYLVCGFVIVGSMAMVGVANLFHWNDSWPALLTFESTAVEAFAVSWLVKGGFLGILADQPAP